ncbi:CcdC family protein [Jeotgalibacillus terrae]|uniref:CcdC family protein n=1 Tax=Jeotgalibacillus terrae TaxID=587735 RepID=A0ABW5ZN73_9BACL|nr:cytochrome c biogenesis protein CcdC [Jeotgalibacillus terrae]MBM7580262.1 membrane protein CcdC involved in cytochrome C biogenesis [Jeotgalibacillus terrae]
MLVYLSTIAAIFMGAAVFIIRLKAAKKPVTAKKIFLPPIFMSTGALMFIFPYFRVTPLEALEALVVGAVFSVVLIKTSKFEQREDGIYLKASKAFPFILIGLLVIRVIMKLVLSTSIDVGTLSGMFWILAFGMIVPWRSAMLIQFKKMEKSESSRSAQLV